MHLLYPQLACIDVPSLVAACTDEWYNQTLCQVNESVVRLGVVQREYHWHKHDKDDEFFFVLDGELFVDLRDRTVTLRSRQGFVVPRGIEHRTRVTQRDVVYAAMTATLDVPIGDQFQVISEHESTHLVIDPHYLGIERTADAVVIQVTLSEGRTTDQKKGILQGYCGWTATANRVSRRGCLRQSH